MGKKQTFDVFHTCKLCDLQLSLCWQTWEPVLDLAAWTPLPPFVIPLPTGLWYFLSGLKSQNIASLFKYKESTIKPLRTINRSVRRDLCVRSIRSGHNEPSRISMSKTYSTCWFVLFRFFERNCLIFDWLGWFEYIQPLTLHDRKILQLLRLQRILLSPQRPLVSVSASRKTMFQTHS